MYQWTHPTNFNCRFYLLKALKVWIEIVTSYIPAFIVNIINFETHYPSTMTFRKVRQVKWCRFFFLFFFCNPYKHTHADRFQTSDFESQNNIFHKANKFCWLWIEYVAVKWTKWLKIQFVQRTSFRRIADQSLSFPSAMILIYIFRLKKAGDISLSFKRPPICF